MFTGVIISNSKYANYNFNAFLLSLIIISVPVLVALIMPLIHNKSTKMVQLFLYSFSVGFFIVLGLFGEANEALEVISSSYQDNKYVVLIQISVVAGGALVALAISLALKLFLSKKFKVLNWNGPLDDHDKHDAYHNHIHPEDIIFDKNLKISKNKWLAIFLILSHRVGAGLFLGYTVYQIVSGNGTGVSVSFLIGFFLHMVPEEFIVFYRLRQIGFSQLKSLKFSILMILMLIPFIFIGTNIGLSLDQAPWISGFIHIFIGAFFVFTALVELMPEIISEAKTQKNWYKAIIFIILGIIVAFIILNFHSHGHEHSHDHDYDPHHINSSILINNSTFHFYNNKILIPNFK